MNQTDINENMLKQPTSMMPKNYIETSENRNKIAECTGLEGSSGFVPVLLNASAVDATGLGMNFRFGLLCLVGTFFQEHSRISTRIDKMLKDGVGM